MHINSQTRVILVSSIENMLLGLIRTADMLSLSLGDSRIFFVWEMKFPYKKIFHTQKKCGEILYHIFLSTNQVFSIKRVFQNQKMWKIPIKEIVGF